MYNNFIKITQSSITYNRVSTIFNHNFNLRFRKPRTDICQLCYDYEIQLKNNQNNFNLQLKKKDYSDYIKRAEEC